jgi:hypothetical protein
MSKEQRRALAEQIYLLYNAMLLTQIHRGQKKTTVPFEKVAERVVEWFHKAADDCHEADAKPKQWIEAQFTRFELFSRKFGKHLLPQPHQLCGPAAQVRFKTFKDSLTRRPSCEDRALKKHSREERKLKGLIRITRQLESDVLLARPEEFTPDFLRHKGVWNYVESKYRSRV